MRSSITRLCRSVAAFMPAFVIGYSALVDPLINFDLAPGFVYGGIETGEERKSTFLTKLVMPGFLASSIILAMFAKPVLPARLRMLAGLGAVFLSLAFVSALWAKAPIMTLSLAAYQAILFGSLLIFVAVANDPSQIMRYIILMFALVIAVNLAAVMLRPSAELGHQGIYDYKNTLGAAGGCALLFAMFNLMHGSLFWRIVTWFTALGAVVVTYASNSKTVVALIIAAPLIAGILYATSRLLTLGPILTGALLLALSVQGIVIICLMLGMDTDDILLATFGDATFTGRTKIWLFTLDHIEKSPLLGNGFRGFWSLDEASPKVSSEIEFIRIIGSAHNGYLDMTLDLGLVGLGLLILFIFAALSLAGKFNLRPRRSSLMYLSFILFLIGRNMMESVILWSTFFDNLCFLLVSFLACYKESPSVRRFYTVSQSRGTPVENQVGAQRT